MNRAKPQTASTWLARKPVFPIRGILWSKAVGFPPKWARWQSSTQTPWLWVLATGWEGLQGALSQSSGDPGEAMVESEESETAPWHCVDPMRLDSSGCRIPVYRYQQTSAMPWGGHCLQLAGVGIAGLNEGSTLQIPILPSGSEPPVACA